MPQDANKKQHEKNLQFLHFLWLEGGISRRSDWPESLAENGSRSFREIICSSGF